MKEQRAIGEENSAMVQVSILMITTGQVWGATFVFLDSSAN